MIKVRKRDKIKKRSLKKWHKREETSRERAVEGKSFKRGKEIMKRRYDKRYTQIDRMKEREREKERERGKKREKERMSKGKREI